MGNIKNEIEKLNELKSNVNDMLASKLISEADCKSITEKVDDLLHDLGGSEGGAVKVTCAGIYNSGKSSVLNALTGGQHFKVGDVPTTSTIDEFVCDGLVYVDTPGLNANDLDTETAQRAFKDATVILFISNMISGGLTAAEADYLKKLSEILGGVENLRKQVVFAMSNLHQISDESIEKIVGEHKSNIKSVLGFEPDNIVVYDAVTYESGVQSNSPELIKSSGVNDLKKVIADVVEAVSRQSGNIYDERVSTKRAALSETVRTTVAPIEKRLEKLMKQSEEKTIDPQSVNEAIEKCGKIVEAAKGEMKIPEFSCSNISDNDLSTEKSFFPSCKSEYDVMSKMRRVVQHAYDQREEVIRYKADRFTNKLEQLIGNNAFIKEVNDLFDKAILRCNDIMKEVGVVSSVSLIKSIDIPLPSVVFNRNTIWQDVCEDVVEYGGYYTVDQYLDMYCNIDERDHFVGYGFFNNEKYETQYSGNCFKCILEMAGDMHKTYYNNCRKIWGHYFPDKASVPINGEIPNNYTEYCLAVKNELDHRLKSMISEAKNVVDSVGRDSEKEIKQLKQALDSVEEFLN